MFSWFCVLWEGGGFGFFWGGGLFVYFFVGFFFCWFEVGFFFFLQDWLLGFKYSVSVAYFCVCVLLSLFSILTM